MLLFSGGDLIDYYAEQHKSKKHGKERGGYTDHGWRRAGDTALKRLSDRGFMESAGMTTYSIPLFRLTERGRTAAAEVKERGEG